MASEIAKLLNSSYSDNAKLHSLIQEYLLTNEDDYDLVLDPDLAAQEIVGDDDGEKQDFR